MEERMFVKRSDGGYREPAPGITFRTLSHGQRTLMAEFRLSGGSLLPAHSHPHEQSGYLVAGALRLVIGGEVCEVAPGDSWCIPGGVEHRAEVLEDSVAVEVFSPVREDYLADR
jgi:quercetin dioxygenase-like cupin family protein